MNREVLISMKGLQAMVGDEEAGTVETITRGRYYFRENIHNVFYEETLDGEATVKSSIKFDEHHAEIVKKGSYNVQMLFEQGRKNYTEYHTPFGTIVICFDAKSILVDQSEDRILLTIDYNMEINYENTGECRIEIEIKNCESK